MEIACSSIEGHGNFSLLVEAAQREATGANSRNTNLSSVQEAVEVAKAPAEKNSKNRKKKQRVEVSDGAAEKHDWCAYDLRTLSCHYQTIWKELLCKCLKKISNPMQRIAMMGLCLFASSNALIWTWSTSLVFACYCEVSEWLCSFNNDRLSR